MIDGGDKFVDGRESSIPRSLFTVSDELDKVRAGINIIRIVRMGFVVRFADATTCEGSFALAVMGVSEVGRNGIFAVRAYRSVRTNC